MTFNAKTTFTVLAVVIAANLIGVLLFFQPLTAGDQSLINVHPAIGLLTYAGVCTWIYLWAYHHIGHSYRSALVLVLPQAALIIDLTLRGDRGVVTALAGIALLVFTWFAVAYVHSYITSKPTQLPPNK